ncbi:hypothetical protein T4D_444 [Trichinella pseudospiralis]|uniref:Secreted protein n=1 Tax=Trichinella pseudospiralis TaxID=6337 RepID=A0A0V1FXJ9_TRIPS|nr:hypothetical protein T4D_444 [Trichinella pseudospiralis]
MQPLSVIFALLITEQLSLQRLSLRNGNADWLVKAQTPPSEQYESIVSSPIVMFILTGHQDFTTIRAIISVISDFLRVWKMLSVFTFCSSVMIREQFTPGEIHMFKICFIKGRNCGNPAQNE